MPLLKHDATYLSWVIRLKREMVYCAITGCCAQYTSAHFKRITLNHDSLTLVTWIVYGIFCYVDIFFLLRKTS